MKYSFMILLLVLMGCGHSGDSLNKLNPLKQIFGSDHSSSSSDTEVLDASGIDFLALVNDHRHGLGSSAITYSRPIQDTSQTHSQDMANQTVAFGHSGSSERCAEIEGALGGGNLCGEIIAMGQKTAQAAFDSWMSSPGHRAIIENPRYTHTGLGQAKNFDGTIYWTAIFLELK